MKGRDVGFQTTKEGEFWRVLLPGIYTMEVFAEGFQPREVQFAVIEQNPTLLNITLYSDNPRRAGIDLSQELEDGEDSEDAEEDDGADEDASGLFGITNPFTSLQKNIQSTLESIPFFG